MGRRRELKSISLDLSHSLNTRNNDYLGYWATGQLYSLAKDKEFKSVFINVLEEEMDPYIDYFANIFDVYRSMLNRQLSARKLSSSWVNEFTLEFNFEQEIDKDIHKYIGIGKPYSLDLVIKSDVCVTYAQRTGAYCRPHDPSREWRSARHS